MTGSACGLFLQEDIQTLQEIMRRAEPLAVMPVKEAGKAYLEIAASVCAEEK
jgi:hypothetical protein